MQDFKKNLGDFYSQHNGLVKAAGAGLVIGGCTSTGQYFLEKISFTDALLKNTIINTLSTTLSSVGGYYTHNFAGGFIAKHFDQYTQYAKYTTFAVDAATGTIVGFLNNKIIHDSFVTLSYELFSNITAAVTGGVIKHYEDVQDYTSMNLDTTSTTADTTISV